MYSQIFPVMGLINCTLFSITFKNSDLCASGETIVCMNVVILVFQTPLAGISVLFAHAAPVVVLMLKMNRMVHTESRMSKFNSHYVH